MVPAAVDMRVDRRRWCMHWMNGLLVRICEPRFKLQVSRSIPASLAADMVKGAANNDREELRFGFGL